MKVFFTRKFLTGMLIILILSIVSLGLDLSGSFDIPEHKTIDLRTRICRSGKALPPEIALILVDEASLSALNKIAGRWPWPRSIHADLLDFLAMSGGKSILMDIMFTEHQAGQMLQCENAALDDARLVESTFSAQNVFHAVQITRDSEDEFNKTILNQPLPKAFVNRFSIEVNASTRTTRHNKYYLPFKKLYAASNRIGVVSFSHDEDAVYRGEKLLFNYQDKFFPSLSIAPILCQPGISDINLNKDAIKFNKNNSPIVIPLRKNNRYIVNMYSKYNVYSYSGVILSMLKIQQGELDNLPVNPEEFKDKVIFVGASAAGVEDLKHTSISTKTPGVYLHASIYGNIITQDFLHFTGRVINFIPIILLLTITVFSIFYFKTVQAQVLVPLSSLAGFITLAFILFQANIVINTAISLVAVIFAYIVAYTYIRFTEGKEKKKIRNILGQYVSPAMLSDVLDKNKDDYLKAEIGTKEVLTMFFSDIRGFTSISEKYSEEKVVEVLNSYLSGMVDIIFNNQGTLDKFIGDAIMAFWGAPVKIDDHHYKAVISAIQMLAALEECNRENEEKGLPHLQIGIGIHTGEVILGNIGSEQMLDYTVIGDNVNLTSRLEGLTKNYNCSIIISQDTYEHVKDRIACKIVDYVKVKGKEKPIRIFEVLGEAGKIGPSEINIALLTTEAFNYYSKKQFSEAIAIYEKILELKPQDYLTQMYIFRCREYISEPPPDNWDGYFVHKTK